MEATTIELRPGQMLTDRYRLVERCGAGGMCVVWRGHDELLDRDVAVKVLLGRYAAHEDLRQGIRREARAAARVSHPNIAHVFDYGEAPLETGGEYGENVPFVVMELVGGEPWSDSLVPGQRLPWREAVFVCAQVAGALAAAHAEGVVHRDVKPANVMLTSAGVKLVDFGIAAAIGERESGRGHLLLGTPAYMAPERIAGGRAGPAADVYGLGLLLYRALAGQLPWPAVTEAQIISAHRNAAPQPLPELPGLPAEVTRLCHQCLAKDPADRPSMMQAARTLDEALTVPALERTQRLPAIGVSTVEIHTAALTQPMPAWERYLDRVVTPLTTLRRRPTVAGVGLAAFVVVLAVFAVASGLLGPWLLSRAQHTDAGMSGGAPAAPIDAAAPISCQVRYAVTNDRKHTFSADVQVSHAGANLPDTTTLRFVFPNDQTIMPATSGWRQSGAVVSTDIAGPWAAGDPVTLHFAAVYRDGNGSPTAFFLGNTGCAVSAGGEDHGGDHGSSGHDGGGDGSGGHG